MAQQISDPFGILDVRLATGHGFDVLGVGQQHLELSLKQVERRLPVNARALHSDVRAAGRHHPIHQRQEVVRHRPEGAHLLDRTSLWSWHDQAGDYRLLVHIHAAAARIYYFYHWSSPRLRAHAGSTVRGSVRVAESAVRALHTEATVGASWGHSGQSEVRARSTRQTPTFVRPHRRTFTIPRAAPIFIRGGGLWTMNI